MPGPEEANATHGVDDYLAAQPEATRQRLERIREIVHQELPEVEERMAYHMPTFALGGVAVVHLAGWKHHVSLYPMPEGDPELERDAQAFISGRGTVKLPLAKPLPEDLVRRMVRALAARSGAG